MAQRDKKEIGRAADRCYTRMKAGERQSTLPGASQMGETFKARATCQTSEICDAFCSDVTPRPGQDSDARAGIVERFVWIFWTQEGLCFEIPRRTPNFSELHHGLRWGNCVTQSSLFPGFHPSQKRTGALRVLRFCLSDIICTSLMGALSSHPSADIVLQQFEGRLQASYARRANHLQIAERITDDARRGAVLQRPLVFP